MIKNIYICSAGHSGSTLLDMLIGSHSRIESLGEITHLPKNLALNTICGCGSPVRECEFWKGAISNIERKLNIDLVSNPYILDLGYISARIIVDKRHQTIFYNLARKISHGLIYIHYRHTIPLYYFLLPRFEKSINNNHLLYQSVRNYNDAGLIVDSSKAYLKGLGVYLHNKDETRIIVLVRDGRGVFYSNLKRGFDRRKSLNGWINYYQRALVLIDKYVNKEHVLFVKYEDLAKNTKKVMEDISKFIDVEYESAMLDFSSKVHHITNGNNTRFKSSKINLDEAWKNNLNESDLNYFNVKALDLNKRLGYE